MDIKKVEIDLRIKPSSDVATKIIHSLLDFLLHSRHQIPFQLRIFQQLVDHQLKDECRKKDWKIERQLKMAIETIERVNLMKNLINSEFTIGCPLMILFGNTIQTAKESYLICFPRASETCNSTVTNLTSAVSSTMLKIVQSDEFQSGKDDQLPTTNVFVLFKNVCKNNHADLIELRSFKLAKSCKKFTIYFRDPTDFEIFDDNFKDLSLSEEKAVRTEKTEDLFEDIWFQSKNFVKGFKDSLVNNKSIWN